jgi:hypothetical protein
MCVLNRLQYYLVAHRVARLANQSNQRNQCARMAIRFKSDDVSSDTFDPCLSRAG